MGGDRGPQGPEGHPLTRSVRAVSLVPSATETLLAWGVRPVAVTRFCEEPGIHAVGGTKDPDLTAIAALAPDVVVMCVEENRREDADALEAAGMRVHAVSIDAVEDVAPELRRLAEVLGVAPLVEDLPPRPDTPLSRHAFVPIWRRPWMTIGSGCYGTSLLARIGVDNVFATSPSRYPEITLDAAVAAGPDVVLAPDEPYPFSERHRVELETVAPVRFVDGKDLFWWGVRTPGALARLAAALGG